MSDGSRVSRAGERRVGVLGARSLVGSCLLPQLEAGGWEVVAFSRRADTVSGEANRQAVQWLSLSAAGKIDGQASSVSKDAIPHWICLAPIWVLPEHFGMLEGFGARRVVALSSTSRFTKEKSADLTEQSLARRLAEAEACLVEWAKGRGIEATILRPTLIYGLGRDENVSVIARFILRFGFFPLLSSANGLRQPVHAADVAAACMAAVQHAPLRHGAYNLSGAEVLTYREMVARVFGALQRPVRFVRVPTWTFQIAMAALRVLPRFRHWSPQMAERMNTDLVFNHVEAARDLSFAPRGFTLAPEDLPAR